MEWIKRKLFAAKPTSEIQCGLCRKYDAAQRFRYDADGTPLCGPCHYMVYGMKTAR